MNKKSIFCLMFSCMVLILLLNVSALGVTPGRKIVQFVPGDEQSLSFKIINSEDESVNLKIIVNGDLNESFIFENEKIIIDAGAEMDINYKFIMPSELTPGTHNQEITIVEVAETGTGSSIGAVVGVITQLQIRVAYPGKYAQVEFNVESAEAEQEVLFYLPITNLGQENLKSVSASIDIFDNANNKIAFVSTEKSPIQAGERKELIANWKADVTPGVYKAIAKTEYDGEEFVLEKTFNIGEKVLELTGVNVKSFTLGEIAKFEMDVENRWGDDIKNVYSQTHVFDENKNLIADFKSPTYDIGSLSNQTFFSYWDTDGIKKGTYDASVYLKYGEKFSKKNVQFEVSSNSIRTLGLGYVISEGNIKGDVKTKILITVIVILIILNLLWFVIFRKKMQGKINKKSKDNQ